MPFDHACEVKVRAETDTEWSLLQEIGYEGKNDRFVVPLDERTDFASVPRMLVWFLPQYGRYTKAAILHDYLWRKAVPAGEVTLPEADGIFRRAMRELGVPFLRRWLMWGAVRLGALKKPGGRSGWLRHSWQTIPLAAVALPIVVPPAVLILIALAVFYVIEWVVYLPLRIARLASPRTTLDVDTPPKEVNPPSFDLRLS